ncbi:hypothetical protein C922_02034 [Plasmodium inui San Antonio 1]|uniref:CS domain-containing protein n=1 Tax=Plasmodium inui San Antonio 1 TaxID=1237626 RepID=W7A7R7_9APIC|nr:hypothetical protein C922_02034 [Plasmodium inui San Antonio 1]EUD67328.1 hypothetical protein C922_02034 [Plasmodium inui San Antonio 1]
MNRVCLLVAIYLALSHSSNSVTEQHTAAISFTLQRRSNVCVKSRRGKSHKGSASLPRPSLSFKQISIVKRPAKLCRYLFCKPFHRRGRNTCVQDGEQQFRDAKKGGNKTTYVSTALSRTGRYYKGGYHVGKAWFLFALHEGGAEDRRGMRKQKIGASKQGGNNEREEEELVTGGNDLEEANKREGSPHLSGRGRTDGTLHPNEERLTKAMQRAEDYIKGKEDDVLERREVQKKKKIIEKLKGQEDVFSDKFLDLGVYDVLKHVYEAGLYADSKSLVEAVCRWMRRAYTAGASEKRPKEGPNEKSSPRTDTSPRIDTSPCMDTSREVPYLVEKDLADNYSRDGGEKIVNHFRLDPPGEEKGSDEMESLKLYNKKNLRKYFFSLNRGNILKQLVTEGEDEILEPTEESPQGREESKRHDEKSVPNEQVKNVLSSNSLLNCDLDTYVDSERYLKSNVTIEFNIYDTFSDRVILNNKNTNSTMLEFPLMYSHQIIQKCILTMKKLEKAIFYINNTFLFGLFSPQEEPMNDEDRRVYDVLTSETWVKMEIYLCNIYRMDEKWLGITPETFADEAKANSFLQSYSGGATSNLVCKPEGGQLATGQAGEFPTRLEEDQIARLEADKTSTMEADKTVTLEADKTSTLKADQTATLNEDAPPAATTAAGATDATAVTATTAATDASSPRRAEIERRREEYESKKDIAIKSELLMKKLENEMKYDPNHYMWKDLYPQLDDRGKERTDKYFKKFEKEMSENKCSRGYTDNIKKKQQLKGYDIGEKIEGRAKHYVWQETMYAFVLYFPLRPYVRKDDINIDMDNTFFFLSIRGHTVVKDFFNKPVNAADSIWSLTDREEDVVVGSSSMQKGQEKISRDEFPLLAITHTDDSEIQKMMKWKYCLVYNIYKDNNHRYMWGSIFKAS